MIPKEEPTMGAPQPSAWTGAGIRAQFRGAAERLQGRETLTSIAPLLGLIALSTFFTAFNPRFLTSMNFVNIARQSAITLVLAVGQTLVILTGAIDLSVEGNMAISGMIVSLLLLNDRNGNNFGFLAIPFGVAVGVLMGLLNGIIHVKARIPSFMVTLGTWFIGLGTTVILYKGYTFPIRDKRFLSLYTGRTAGIPNIAIIAIVLVVVAWVLQKYTRFGRYLYAIGGGEELAKISGIDIDRYKLLTFIVAGLFFGIGGVLNVARLGQGTVLVGSFLFPTIAAVVVGGTSITGGTGGIFRSIIGVLFVTVVGNGMILMGLHPFAQIAIQGLIFIIAVFFTLDRSKIPVLK